MNTDQPVNITPELADESPNLPTTELSNRLPWHAPSITRIDIKRTMFGAGSGTDMLNQTTTGV
ncbi:MAG: hypothetical protein HY868_03560 [Chloroflexi bacterium]|nr:hypothetical protein [Chloroflexota bacterium]